MSTYRDQKNRQMELMLEPARERLKQYSPDELCDKGKITYNAEDKFFCFPSMGQEIPISYPNFEIQQDLEMWHHLTILQYMDTADKTPLSGDWIALPDMPGGLARGTGFDKDIATMFARYFSHTSSAEFIDVCQRLGGEILPGKADVTARIDYAPMFPVLVTFWESDDEFAASGKTLVDAAANHYLTIEAAGGACATVVEEIHKKLQDIS